MSKIYTEQVQKAKMLATGLRRNHDLVKNRGINKEQIAELEQLAGELEKMNQELEALRNEASQKSRTAIRQSAKMRSRMMELKRIVKRDFDPSRWPDFGVQDKR